MPNRYEREIEEILRSLEQPEAKPGIGRKLSGRLRRKSSPRPVRQHHYPSLNLSTSERLLVAAVVAALIGGGYSFTHGGADIFSCLFVVVSLICLLVVVVLQFRSDSRHIRTKHGNMTVTPLRRNPVSMIKTQWNLFRLKLRYRRKNEE